MHLLKKKSGDVLLILFTLVLLLNRDVKGWVLQQLIRTGLFDKKIEMNNTLKKNTLGNSFFKLKGMNGNMVTSEALKGKVVFINFWASWCPPCRAEMPSLQALYNKLKNEKQIVFLFIAEDNNIAEAKKFVEDNGMNIPIYSRLNTVPDGLYDGTLPTTIVFNKKGDVVLKHKGLANYNTVTFIKQLHDLQ